MSDSENEGDQPGILLEGDEEETLQGRERLRGPEEMVDELIPWLREPFEAQEQPSEGRGDGSPGTRSSISAEEVLNSLLLLEESLSLISISGYRALGTAVKPFLCWECGKSFARRYNRDLHQSRHAGEKSYQCSECGKSFRYRQSLAEHKRIHTWEKPCICSECGKSFRSNPQLIAH